MDIREVGKQYIMSYKDCKTDADGWVDAKNTRPKPFDLMHLKVKRDGKFVKGSLPGWWTGSSWDGQRFKEKDEIIYWKQKPEASPCQM